MSLSPFFAKSVPPSATLEGRGLGIVRVPQRALENATEKPQAGAVPRLYVTSDAQV